MIAVLEVELTHYRIPVYARLQERLDEDVVVYHGVPTPGSGLNVVEPERELDFVHRRLGQRWLFGGRIVVNNPLPILRCQERPRAVIMRYTIRNPMLPFLLSALHHRGIPVIGWGHGYSRRRTFQPRRHPADRAHLLMVRRCDAFVCYSERNRDVLARHLPPQQLFVARNVVDTEPLFALRRRLDRQGRAEVCRQLGLDPHLPYCSFIGRLQARKRPAMLLEACAYLRDRKGLRLGVLFVGDGSLREELQQLAAELQLAAVVFAGARYGEDAARYLYVSDVMAMPGALGLAAPHALALGVPVVTQRLGAGLIGHGPEAAYVIDGVTGRIAPRGPIEMFATALEDVLLRRTEYSRNAADFAVRNLRLDDMVGGLVRAIESVAG